MMRPIVFVNEKFDLPPLNRCAALVPLGKGPVHPRFAKLPAKVQDAIRRFPVGVEVEVEWGADRIRVPGMNQVQDGSLRNHGIEFVTAFGVRLDGILKILEGFEKEIVEYRRFKEKGAFTFSERTSVHTHLDVRHWTDAQVQNLLVLYTLFEKSLFGFVHPKRSHNIFTIPLRSWDGMGKINSLDQMLQNMNRYCALNLQALPKYGTIEYRHMEGNCNSDYIFTWLCLLALLHYAAMRMSTQEVREFILDIKSSSDYTAALSKIFFSFRDLLHADALDTDNAASDAKLFFFE